MDFSGMTGEEDALARIAEARAFIMAQPAASLYTLTDVRGSTFGPKSVEAVKHLAKDDVPFVRAAAVVGVSGLARIVMSVVTLFSGRTFGTFDTIEEARDWLAEQGG